MGQGECPGPRGDPRQQLQQRREAVAAADGVARLGEVLAEALGVRRREQVDRAVVQGAHLRVGRGERGPNGSVVEARAVVRQVGGEDEQRPPVVELGQPRRERALERRVGVADQHGYQAEAAERRLQERQLDLDRVLRADGRWHRLRVAAARPRRRRPGTTRRRPAGCGRPARRRPRSRGTPRGATGRGRPRGRSPRAAAAGTRCRRPARSNSSRRGARRGRRASRAAPRAGRSPASAGARPPRARARPSGYQPPASAGSRVRPLPGRSRASVAGAPACPTSSAHPTRALRGRPRVASDTITSVNPGAASRDRHTVLLDSTATSARDQGCA